MRILVVFILLAFGLQSQQTTVNGQQTLCTVPEPVEGTTLGASTSSATAYSTTVDYYENQIRLADSLYKNYLPQSNFEEVKAAVEFFDSYQPSAISGQRWRFFDSYQQSAISGQRWRLFDKEADDGNRLIAESRQLTAAKAHYYHAVGLTEKDDIVGACEHYLIALEIMEDDDLIKRHKDTKTQRHKVLKKQRNDEKTLCDSVTLRLCDSNKEDYEKIRFVALIYNRLGRLFYNESFCDLAIIKYRKAISYVKLIKDFSFEANLLKELANSYQLSNNADSALSYYKKSLKTSCNPSNKLDIDKSIAQIMYLNKGERDSAIMMLRSNLNKIHDEKVKYSYHFVLGNIFYHNKNYDSAFYYLKESLDDSIINNKIAFTTTLSAIYDSIGNHEKRAYYDNLSSKLFFDNINKEVDKSKLQGLYNNYNERKVEKIKKEAKAITIKNIVIISVCVSISVVLLFLYIKYKHRKHSNRLISEIDTYAKEVECKNCIINEKEQLVKDYQEINVKKDEIIRKQKKELDKIKHKSDILDKKTKLDIFYKSDICENILKRDGLDLIPLTENELQLLMTTANYNLDNLIARLFNEFPKLTTIDMQCICLVVLLNNNSKIAYMLGRNRKTIWDRINRIKNIMGLDIKGDLFLHIIENYI